MGIVKKISTRLRWMMGSLSWLSYDAGKSKNGTLDLSIGITTFLGRYENCFKDLVTKLSKLFPDEQIIVAVNGHYKKEEQLRYLKEMTDYCKQFGKVELITHTEAVGLSKIWNEIISRSSNSKVMILNDDLEINPGFREEIKNAMKENELIVINRSWSHFIISKTIFSKVGPFDEGLLELGGEDDDYSARCAMAGVEIIHRQAASIKPKLKEHEKKSGINSYGKRMSAELHGYSTYNSNYLNEKWRTENSYFDGAVYLPDRKPSYWKLKNK